jgi:hypothetical protein
VFCREENAAVDDFIKVKVTFLFIRGYPTIFDEWDCG